MVLRLAGLPVWTPTDMIAGARAVMGWIDEAIGMVAALPERVSGLLDDVDVLVARITEVADRVEVIVGRIDPMLCDVSIVAESAATLVARANVVAENAAGLVARAGDVTEEAGTTSRTAQELLEAYAPIAGKAAPLAKRFVDELSEAEVQAAIRLIDQLPLFTDHMETDIMPILATLDRVGPDVHELLDVLKEVRQAINGIPGFDYFRRRGEREEATEQQPD